jgi:DNA-nicking Smr family endonuclease
VTRRRPRGLTAADRALWHDFARRTGVVPRPGVTITPPPAPVVEPAAAPAPAVTLASPATPKPARRAEIAIGVPPSGLDGKRWKELRRGRIRPERVLDLHGRRVQEAHDAVRRFLADSVADGLRCVAIVTGKGSSTEGGVLRRELPHWLNAPELRPLLLGAAHPHTANPGAVHLLLRRRK